MFRLEAITITKPTTPEDKALEKAVHDLRTFNGIAIVGAGASFESGMPLAGQLAPIVWQTLDENHCTRKQTAEDLAIKDATGKELVGDDWPRMVTAIQFIGADTAARRSFQATFARLDADRRARHAPAHDALAKLVHAGLIELVVSLNWDTLLENAFSERYGTDINANAKRLVKPHGDAQRPEIDWALPHEPGHVPDALVQQVQSFVADRPRVLIVVGYSEQDEVVVERLIRPLADNWRVFRIGPSVTGEGAIQLPAIEALQRFAGQLCDHPEIPGWRYLTFANQRGLAAAIKGERLTPNSAEACPRLPQVETTKQQLKLVHHAVICGPPGCGKSITAFQIANDLRQEGWEILRLANPEDPLEDLVQAATRAPTPKVLLVDDAQCVDPGLLERLKEIAAADTAVLISKTDRSAGSSQDVRISSTSAVETLREAFLARRDEVLAIVSTLDDQVGDRYLDTTIEQRIESAAEAESAWQFNFILRGNWRNAKSELETLKDFERADMILVAIAALQIAQLDKPVRIDALKSFGATLGRDEEYIDKTLGILRQREVILPTNVIRCPHIKYAADVLARWCDNQHDPEYDTLVSFLQSTLKAEDTPLRGVSWLLADLHSHQRKRLMATLITHDAREQLLARCLAAKNAADRRDALWALGQLCRWGTEHCERIAENWSVLAGWLEDIEDENAGAFGSLLSWLWNYDRDSERRSASADAILSASKPEKVAKRFCLATQPFGYGWGELLQRLSSLSDPEWRARFWSAVDNDSLLQYVAEFKSTQLAHLSKIIQGIAAFDEENALVALEKALPAIEAGLNDDPLRAWRCIGHDLTWFVLGYSWFRRRKPNSRQRKLARRIAALIPVAKTAEDLSSSRQPHWEPFCSMLAWASEVDPQIHQEIVSTVDLDQLSEKSRGLWTQPPRELRLLISVLAIDEDHEPSRSWVARHEDQIEIIDPLTTLANPRVAVNIFKRGGQIDLQGHNRHWGTQAKALLAIKEIDEQVAKQVAAANNTHLVQAIEKLEPIHTDDDSIARYCAVLHRIDNAILKSAVQRADPESAQASWKQRLRERKVKPQRAVAVLALVALDCDGSIADLARSLEKRIPQRVWKQATELMTAP